MEIPEEKKPRLRIEYTNQFGDNTIVETDVYSATLDDLMISIGMAVKAFGFSSENIQEYIPDC